MQQRGNQQKKEEKKPKGTEEEHSISSLSVELRATHLQKLPLLCFDGALSDYSLQHTRGGILTQQSGGINTVIVRH